MRAANVKGLRPRELTVLHALDFLAGDDGKVTVSKLDLARALGWRRSSGIRHAIVGLERRGLVRVHYVGTEKDHAPNMHEITALGHEVARAEGVAA